MNLTLQLSNTLDAEQVATRIVHPKISEFISHPEIPQAATSQYLTWLSQNNDVKTELDTYFNAEKQPPVIPIIIYNEVQNTFGTILASTSFAPPEPGEPGSILAYVRAHGFTDNFLCSDCFGQLSCSSCAVDLLKGTPDNPTPREEEYDMLDIDQEKPPTQYTRLGCQVKLGKEALLLKIRKPIKQN